MNLETILALDAPLPKDPYERLIEVHRRWGLVTETTYKTMSSIFPDYADMMDLLMRQISKAERETASYVAPGEA